MSDQWYYSHDDNRVGPFSARQLQELAASGQILPTSTIWKDGVELGQLATRVKHLFSPAQAGAAPVSARVSQSAAAPAALLPAAEPEATPASAEAQAAPAEPGTVTTLDSSLRGDEAEDAGAALQEQSPPAPQQKQARKGRAVSAKGAILLSQDGISVQYKKKCVKCGHEDSSRNRMPIRSGTTRLTFFCPKCKKIRPVEIQGMI